MIQTRYLHAARFANGRSVLEIACGAGLGLGLLSGASFLVGGDIDRDLLSSAAGHYGERAFFTAFSAESLPFLDTSFELVLLFESLYYVADSELALEEVARVLAPGGVVLIVSANPERPDFIGSPFSHRYYTAEEYRAVLEKRGFVVSVCGAFPVGRRGWVARGISAGRRFLERLDLVPRTLVGRARLKRLLYGAPVVLLPELTNEFESAAPLYVLDRGPATEHKVLYIEGTLAETVGMTAGPTGPRPARATPTIPADSTAVQHAAEADQGVKVDPR